MLPRIEHVAVIGAGFSGTLQAINLLRQDGPSVTLIERGRQVARGVAYSTPNPAHLLNVRTANMSALPDEPDHFTDWQRAHRGGAPDGFAARRDYGDYLADMLRLAQEHARGRLVIRQDEACELTIGGDHVEVGMTNGGRVGADVAVLALGNLPPHDPPPLREAHLPADLYVADPWHRQLTDDLDSADEVLIVGTGLTMIDVVLTLEAEGFTGHITALSRRGLIPRAHGGGAPPSRLAERPAARGSGLVHLLRTRAGQVGWRAAVDELRPYTQGMWLNASKAEQRRFLRHARPWWDVHRHRLAPSVADRIEALRDRGRLAIVAGQIVEAVPHERALAVRWRERRGTQIEQRSFRRMINCTGPQGDLLRTREPLLHLLLAAGHIGPDLHRLGIEVNAQSETIDVRGRANPRLLAVGPMTRGTFWEIVAVPDIRRQAWDIARRLAQTAWIGEGL